MIKKIILSLALIAPLPADEKQKIDFPALAAQAERYQLPIPPKGAKLVLANTGWTSVLNQSSSDLDPSNYRPGFLLKTHADGKADILSAFHLTVAESRRAHQPATLPFTTNPPEPKNGGYSFKGNSLTSFAMAIQCARLGDLKNAEGLTQLYLNSDNPDGFHAREASRALPQKYSPASSSNHLRALPARSQQE